MDRYMYVSTDGCMYVYVLDGWVDGWLGGVKGDRIANA